MWNSLYFTNLGSGCGDVRGRLTAPGPLGRLIRPPLHCLYRRLAVLQVDVVVKVDLGPAGNDVWRRFLGSDGYERQQIGRLLLFNELAGGRLGIVAPVLSKSVYIKSVHNV